MCAVSPTSTSAALCELPEFIRDYLDVASATTCSFNPFGTLLAVGTATGEVSIWETALLTKATTLDVSHHRVVQIDWSDDGHFVVVLSGTTVTRLELHAKQKDPAVVTEGQIVAMDLNRRTPHECLLTLAQRPPCIVDFCRRQERRSLPMLFRDLHNENGRRAMAVFDVTGGKILHAYQEGWICTYDAASLKILDVYALPQECRIAGLGVEREGGLLIVYLHDRCPMLFELHPEALLILDSPCLSVREARERIKSHVRSSKGGSVRKELPAWLILKRWLRHPLGRMERETWDVGCGLPQHGALQYFVAGISSSVLSPYAQQHLLHVWNVQTGELDRVLEGPKEGIRHLCWHERERSVVSVSEAGKVYVWSKRYREDWSVFDNGFQELPENEEYVESETEFDRCDSVQQPVPMCERRVGSCRSEEGDEELDVFGWESLGMGEELTPEPLLHLPVTFSPSPEIVVKSEEALPKEVSSIDLPPSPAVGRRQLKVRISKGLYTARRRH